VGRKSGMCEPDLRHKTNGKVRVYSHPTHTPPSCPQFRTKRRRAGSARPAGRPRAQNESRDRWRTTNSLSHCCNRRRRGGSLASPDRAVTIDTLAASFDLPFVYYSLSLSRITAAGHLDLRHALLVLPAERGDPGDHAPDVGLGRTSARLDLDGGLSVCQESRRT
jgi:hypothetical protein